MRVFFVLVTIATLAAANKVSYENYQVFKLIIKSENEAKALEHLVESNNEYTFWNEPSPLRPASVMVSPTHVNEFVSRVAALDLHPEKSIGNVQALIDRQVARGNDAGDKSFGWTRYHNLSEIHDWLDDLAKKYPVRVTPIIGGRSSEGRPIKGVKLSFRRNNPGVFIEAGIHANEWISPATVTYLIKQFLTSREPRVRKLAESYDWYIFPNLNPDGYVYAHTTDRMWRKSRSRPSTGCPGVDLNRNWDYMWMKTGASNDSCSNKYGGKAAFSEMETKTISKYIRSIGDKLFAYIDFHSFGQLLMVPYGHTKEHLDNYNETYAIGLKTASALAERYGTKYTVGTIAEVIYEASGSSLDWVKSTFKLPIAFCYELRDKGKYGMLLPPEEIIPSSQEILDSLIVLFEEAKKYGYPKSRNSIN